ncbi:hypothetical protein SAMN06296273_2668 [Nitrosomonas ureae]|uniref:Uncharacterized protein n=1 Tax=Nitrosomonas ureae TaxID=44577 RepID=A0A285C245_9PROT|nr:hypothetical protein [Nitrosomonas ureae]SNX61216.1 hypothetical protein SAMN06296273_2668 [Nitrosomonas ureae]
MNIKKRLEKLETVSKVKTVKVDVIRIIFEPDGTISGAIHRNANGERVIVLDEELKILKKKGNLHDAKIKTAG